MEISDFVFMDFEASSLRDGYPIEVGWAWVEGGSVYANGMLIAPADEWVTPGFVWDPMAEGIHGISFSRLQADGTSPAEVCSILNGQLIDRIVVFDTGSVGFDRQWLDLLYYEGNQHPHFKLGGSAGEVLLSLAAGHDLTEADLMQIKKRAPEMTHRAAVDAAHYAWCAAAIQMIGLSLDDRLDSIVSRISLRVSTRG